MFFLRRPDTTRGKARRDRKWIDARTERVGNDRHWRGESRNATPASLPALRRQINPDRIPLVGRIDDNQKETTLKKGHQQFQTSGGGNRVQQTPAYHVDTDSVRRNPQTEGGIDPSIPGIIPDEKHLRKSRQISFG